MNKHNAQRVISVRELTDGTENISHLSISYKQENTKSKFYRLTGKILCHGGDVNCEDLPLVVLEAQVIAVAILL